MFSIHRWGAAQCGFEGEFFERNARVRGNGRSLAYGFAPCQAASRVSSEGTPAEGTYRVTFKTGEWAEKTKAFRLLAEIPVILPAWMAAWDPLSRATAAGSPYG